MLADRADAAIDRVTGGLPRGGGAVVDVYPIRRRLILGITLRAFFGDWFAARVDEVGDLFVRPQRFIEAPAVQQLPNPFPFTFRAKVRADRRTIDRLIDDEIAVRRRQSLSEAPDVLDAYLASGLSDVEIRDQVRSLIGAGYDTTAATFAWMMLRCAHTPGVWARLRAEADYVLGTIDQQPANYDAVTFTNLVYAGRVVHEALRLHPAGLLGVRAAGVDVRLGDHRIRRGTLIAWLPYLAGRDPASWEEPLRFNPDRFADLTPDQEMLSDQAWVLFGRGPHSCLGFALAQMELTLILAKLAQRLDITPNAADLPRPLGMVVNRPEGAHPCTSHPGSTERSTVVVHSMAHRGGNRVTLVSSRRDENIEGDGRDQHAASPRGTPCARSHCADDASCWPSGGVHSEVVLRRLPAWTRLDRSSWRRLQRTSRTRRWRAVSRHDHRHGMDRAPPASGVGCGRGVAGARSVSRYVSPRTPRRVRHC